MGSEVRSRRVGKGVSAPGAGWAAGLVLFGGLAFLLVALFGAGWLSPPFGMYDDDKPEAFRVVLDPGHAADEVGAEGFGLIESDSNLDMAKRVGALLTSEGIEVVYTRTGNERVTRDGRNLEGYSAIFADLESRIAIANKAEADLFISIHSNGFADPSARGLEVIFNPDRSFGERNRELAEAIRANIVTMLEEGGYVPPPSMIRDETTMTDAAGRTTPFFVLGPERELSREEMDDRGGDWDALGYGGREAIRTKATEMPAVLVELLYITNEDDAALLTDDSARHSMAMGIAEGVKSLLEAHADP